MHQTVISELAVFQDTEAGVKETVAVRQFDAAEMAVDAAEAAQKTKFRAVTSGRGTIQTPSVKACPGTNRRAFAK